jgi:hypothetical protein
MITPPQQIKQMTSAHNMEQIIFDVLTSKTEILNALLESEDSNCIVGINSTEFNAGPVMTVVKEILHNDGEDAIVILNSYDATGYFLDKNKISLASITSVIPFKKIFGNPYMKGIQKDGPLSVFNLEDKDYII